MKVRIHRYEAEDTKGPAISYDVSIGGSFGVLVELPVEHYEAFCKVISDYEDCQETLEKMYEIASGRKQEGY